MLESMCFVNVGIKNIHCMHTCIVYISAYVVSKCVLFLLCIYRFLVAMCIHTCSIECIHAYLKLYMSKTTRTL